jgi:hypothetical protein
VSRSMATTATFWLAMVKVGSCRSARSINMVWLVHIGAGWSAWPQQLLIRM